MERRESEDEVDSVIWESSSATVLEMKKEDAPGKTSTKTLGSCF